MARVSNKVATKESDSDVGSTGGDKYVKATEQKELIVLDVSAYLYQQHHLAEN